MQGSQPTMQIRHPVARCPCPSCGVDMMTNRIERDVPGYELRTFECTKCRAETFYFKKLASARLLPRLDTAR
jgi:hypothetical protein